LGKEEIVAFLNAAKREWQQMEEVRRHNEELSTVYNTAMDLHRQWVRDSAEEGWWKLFYSDRYVQFGGPEDIDEYIRLSCPKAPDYKPYNLIRRKLLEEELAALEQALRS
jgi:hypothetical protein